MKKKWIAVMALGLAAVAAFHVTPVKTSASDALFLEDFSSGVLKNGWTTVSEDQTNAVSVTDGRLVVENVNGATEIRLPTVDSKNYVVEFTAERLSGDTWFSLKYRLSEDYKDGYEARVHYPQKMSVLGSYAEKYMDDTTGECLEHWLVSGVDVAAGKGEGSLRQFGCFATEIFENVTYTYRLEVIDDLIELYIDGVRYMRDYLDVNTDSGRLAFRVSGETSVAFDNITVYSPLQYAEKKLSSLPEILAGQNDRVFSAYKRAVAETETYLKKVLTDEEIKFLKNYGNLVKTKVDIETHYGEIANRKPVISVNWNLKETYRAGTRIKLPQATATDKNGTVVAVTSVVYFGENALKISADGYYDFNEKGAYKIVYTAVNVYGETTIAEYSVTVK
ncbi:MAG: hypothetical protein IJB97_08005 [Clostridia bacterium]|nr:hypothetical protein [Clostridia bacterium]